MGKVKYTGNGAYFVGVPARDLTEEEWQKLDENERAVLVKRGLYQPQQRFEGKAKGMGVTNEPGVPAGADR